MTRRRFVRGLLAAPALILARRYLIAPVFAQTFDDGLANAPGVAPQWPNAFAPYSIRPTWNVPGVDYGVGIQPGVVLKNPRTDPAMQSLINSGAIIIDNSVPMVEIQEGFNGLVFDGYDFTGLQVANQAINTTFTNSLFGATSGKQPLDTWPALIFGEPDTQSANITLRYCRIEGYSFPIENIIDHEGMALTIEYCYIRNAFGHMIQCGGGGTLKVRFNVFENNGNSDSHTNYIQILDGVWTYTLSNNLTYQQSTVDRPPPPVGANDGTEGFTLDGGSISGLNSYDHNTHISLAGAKNGWMVGVDGAHLSGAATIDCEWNYVDPTGLVNGVGDVMDTSLAFKPGVTVRNNYNLTTGTQFLSYP